MARKRRRRLGHITSAENKLVRQAVEKAGSDCGFAFDHGGKAYDNCMIGVRIAAKQLDAHGFRHNAKLRE